MSRTTFHRPARMAPPPVPEDKLTLATAPQLQPPNGLSSMVMLILPVLTSISMAAYLVSTGRRWLMILGVLFVVSSVALTVAVQMQMRGKTRRTRERQRGRYLEYLGDIRRQAREVARVQHFAAHWVHPSPERLWSIAERRRRVWERRPDDADYLRLRVGAGTAPLALKLVQNKRPDPSVEYDARAVHAAEELVETHGKVDRQPAWIDIGRAGVVSLLGPAEQTRDAAAALLCQLGVLHAPDDVRLAVSTGGDARWDWAKWLPHTFEPGTRARGAEVVPLVAEDLGGLADYLEAELSRAAAARAERGTRLVSFSGGDKQQPGRRLVVVLNDYDPRAAWARSALVQYLIGEAGPQLGITVICLVTDEAHEPGRVDVRVRLDQRGKLTLEGPDPALRADVKNAEVDRIAPALSYRIARALAPLRLSGEEDQALSRSVSLPSMLGIGDVSDFDPTAVWRGPDHEELLRVPVGVAADGEALVLDLKESAQGGIGPHGLVVGATGSGKSELLRTLVTGLSTVHSPEHLGFVLVDFKGGATFAGLTGLPHVAGLITNLSDDLSLVERVKAALSGEQQRRQRLLRSAGNVDSIRDYQKKREAGGTDVDGAPLPPLPYLMIVVDEFGELLSQRGDFIDLFVQIGRVGRSLGMHLLLATQRLELGRLRGLEAHLSYRIALRTFSAEESRAVLGTPDAYRLPAIPGSAYLKVDESVYDRFRVAHVSRLYQAPSSQEARAVPVPPVPFGLRTRPVEGEEETAPEPEPSPLPSQEDGTTELQLVVERLAASSAPTHQVWLPPLPDVFSLDPLLAPVAPVEGRGLQSQGWPTPGDLKFPVGVADLPGHQEQRPLLLDLAGVHGHLAVVGAPQSGKSTFLRTALISAMLTHTPEELQFYCIDFGGGMLHGFEDAPHVAGVAGRRDLERAQRALAEVSRLVDTREAMFAELGIQTAADLRSLRAAGRLPEGVRAADIVLVIDNWGAVHGEMEDVTSIASDIATRGLGVGVHLILTANRWPEIRIGLRDSIGGRLELRLNDAAESEINRQLTRRLGRLQPGRGVMPPGIVFHVPLPRIDGVDGLEDLTDAQLKITAEISAAWQGPPAPRLKVLPQRVTVAELDTFAAGEVPRDPWEAADPAPSGSEVPIGLSQRTLRPVGIDLTRDQPHFLVFGDSGTGRTTFLRTWMRGLARGNSPYDVRFIVIDYRRGLLDVVPEPYIGAHAGEPSHARAFVEQVAEKLRERVPPADIDSRALRERDWWEGPEFYLVVDDYDLVAGGAVDQGPLAPLAGFLAQGTELGFHVMLARRVAGASRTLMSDPLLKRLREFGTDGLILSGDHREGALIGDQRAARRVPGRGVLVRRGREPELIHALIDEETETLGHEPRSDESAEVTRS